MLYSFAECKLCLIFNQCDSVCKGIINIVTFLQCHFSSKISCPDTLQEMQCAESIHDAMLGMSMELCLSQDLLVTPPVNKINTTRMCCLLSVTDRCGVSETHSALTVYMPVY